MLARLARAVILAASLFGAPHGAFAVEPSEMLADPALEARARALSAGLRCLVCQNQSIDDSNAALAADLRVLIRERLAAGDSDGEVLDYLVARYGEFILLKPPVNGQTLLLWLVPPAVLLLGAAVAAVAFRRRARAVPPLDAAEEAALQRVLGDRQ
jgi:cytochrome c-type biogenesis protein CcmH